MTDVLNIFFAPKKAFEKLKEKPTWFVPLLIVVVVVALTAVLGVMLARDSIIAHQEEAMRERGMTDEQIDQAVKFMSGPFMMISGGIGAVIFTVILLLLFAVLLNLLIPVAGGQGNFVQVFSLVSTCALVKVPASFLRLIMIGVTRTPYVSTSLSLLVPGLPKEEFLFRLLSGFDFFVAWEMILVAQGIAVTNGADKKRGYVIVLAIWVASILLSAMLGGFGRRG